ncbi:MAG: TIGR01841 family phasin [Alphaproteobacteria bacterium]|nr:TIGR01841 family phasin [Alphaproteobacteria bacterium]
MTQAKKTSSTAAKLASSAANKAAKSTYSAVESTRSSAENVVKIGSRAAKDFLSQSAGEAQKAQDKILAMSRDGAQQLAKSADAVTKALYETISTSRDNLEAAVECGNVAAALAKDVSSEMMEYANKTFTDNVEMSKELFACRTINDMMELQNRMLKKAMDSGFAQTSRLSNLFFEYSSEALEPINERVAQASEQLSKTLKTVA